MGVLGVSGLLGQGYRDLERRIFFISFGFRDSGVLGLGGFRGFLGLRRLWRV